MHVEMHNGWNGVGFMVEHEYFSVEKKKERPSVISEKTLKVTKQVSPLVMIFKKWNYSDTKS